MTAPLLDVRHLTTVIDTPAGALHPVDDVSFQVPAGSTVALVGESGCGKSMTALSLLRLLPSPPARVAGGSVLFEGADLMALSEREMRQVRGARIAMIFQEPMTSLNPVYTVGAQIVEAIRIHQAVGRRAARARAIELLGTVGIPSPGQRVDAYPHELSGGMRQRVMIAMALSCNPKLLIADEPTTALDVTIQAQILDLLRRLQQTFEMSILFITHDLGVVAEFASQMVVMYAGRVVETGSVREVFQRPLHPYTRALLASVPPANATRMGTARPPRLPTIEGMVPELAALPRGCRFTERCPLLAERPAERERCAEQEPELSEAAPGRTVRCHLAEGAS